jgi:hypothetical protein
MNKILLCLTMFLALAANACGGEERVPRCQESLYDSHARAGWPQCIAPHARSADTPNYNGYYVGGGAAFHGECRCPQEGTWGWDYVGILPKFVDLGWWHGRHAQGGGGSYATDHK